MKMKKSWIWKDSKDDSKANEIKENIQCGKCDQCKYAFEQKEPEPVKRPEIILRWAPDHIHCEECGQALDIKPAAAHLQPEIYFIEVLSGKEVNYCRYCIERKFTEELNHYNWAVGNRRFNPVSERIKRGA